ncbi:hypothetical protein OSB04_012737 [Centaurea solstitialis]|uniref:Cystatin domain-containing protein n=1 Tax=Centaurea solstitialis TaxID=347529 RepID=A0AA38TJF9_9ASTR|nr:hypothetical protein OSB04_012737 [Centaurea solstitialis]
MNNHPSKMENRQFLFVTILIFLLTLISSNYSMAVRTNLALTGGWKPITNVTDSLIVDVGRFAVDEHNKQHKESLKFTKVVNGESQVVGGWNYNLTIKAKDGKFSKVNNHPSKMDNRQLLFKMIPIFLLTIIYYDSSIALVDGALASNWKPITDVTDPTVVDIGKFAVDEHNKQDQESLKFTKVVKGETRVFAGMNYNLTIMAVDGNTENNYVAFVWDKPWQKFRQLLSFKGPI